MLRNLRFTRPGVIRMRTSVSNREKQKSWTAGIARCEIGKMAYSRLRQVNHNGGMDKSVERGCKTICSELLFILWRSPSLLHDPRPDENLPTLRVLPVLPQVRTRVLLGERTSSMDVRGNAS